MHAQTSSPAAYALLDRIGELFAIEADIKGQAPDLRDIISRIADHPIKRIGELLPWNVKH